VKKASTCILLMIIILALAAMACIGGGGGDGDRTNSNNNVLSSAQSNIHSPDATATFGAQQLHIQLTEIARPGNP
jgi:hypothetical protein